MVWTRRSLRPWCLLLPAHSFTQNLIPAIYQNRARMNIRNILQEIEKTEPEEYTRLSGRRHMLKSFGSKVAVAALPLAVGSLFKKAYGKPTGSTVVDALNYLLELEYFQYAFYRTANNTVGLIPASDLPGFQKIELHQKEHIGWLLGTI